MFLDINQSIFIFKINILIYRFLLIILLIPNNENNLQFLLNNLLYVNIFLYLIFQMFLFSLIITKKNNFNLIMEIENPENNND